MDGVCRAVAPSISFLLPLVLYLGQSLRNARPSPLDFQGLEVLVIRCHDRRIIQHTAIPEHPTAENTTPFPPTSV
jgi:hypothetical protein